MSPQNVLVEFLTADMLETGLIWRLGRCRRNRSSISVSADSLFSTCSSCKSRAKKKPPGPMMIFLAQVKHLILGMCCFQMSHIFKSFPKRGPLGGHVTHRATLGPELEGGVGYKTRSRPCKSPSSFCLERGTFSNPYPHVFNHWCREEAHTRVM